MKNARFTTCFKWILVLSLTIISTIVVVMPGNGGSNEIVRSFLRLGLNEQDPCQAARPRQEYKLPFIITNIAPMTSIGNGKFKYSYHSNERSDVIHYLKDVTHCRFRTRRNWIVGTKVTQSEFKIAVKEYLDSTPGTDHVLYNLHGFNNSPETSFEKGAQVVTDYTVIPIQWRNVWGGKIFSGASYEFDRTKHAPRMGHSLGKEFGVFTGVDYKQSIMCHSMGNFVFRVFAQTDGLAVEKAFINYFSVAADVRSDTFSSAFNPAVSDFESSAGLTMKELEIELLGVTEEEKLEGITDDETKPNGGYAITNIAESTHVLWNKGDSALGIRESFNRGLSPEFRKAMGKFGDQSEEMMDEYFEDKIMFHDFTQEPRSGSHGYQWDDISVDLFESWEDRSVAVSVNDQKEFEIVEDDVMVESF